VIHFFLLSQLLRGATDEGQTGAANRTESSEGPCDEGLCSACKSGKFQLVRNLVGYNFGWKNEYIFIPAFARQNTQHGLQIASHEARFTVHAKKGLQNDISVMCHTREVRYTSLGDLSSDPRAQGHFDARGPPPKTRAICLRPANPTAWCPRARCQAASIHIPLPTATFRPHSTSHSSSRFQREDNVASPCTHAAPLCHGTRSSRDTSLRRGTHRSSVAAQADTALLDKRRASPLHLQLQQVLEF
jgi:hypothetical protein